VSGTCVVGLQWGDEAKGKIVDLLTEQHDIVVRFQGGANAGHTVVTAGQTYKLSLIPSGILRPDVVCVITGGVVINPATLLDEIDMLVSRGVRVDSNLLISDRAHVIFPWHLEEERIFSSRADAGDAIGTTMRGIGPCYRDKVGRYTAVRLGDLYRPGFPKLVQRIASDKNVALRARTGESDFAPLVADEICQQYLQYAERLRPYVADTTEYLLGALESGRRVLFEGAQGALLDVDHGTYPFVTSSNSSGLGIPAGAGVPWTYLHRILGVAKAYSTRVGGGPMPTELHDATAVHIRDRGNEYGTVTRRPRRCGWFDAVATRYTARLTGVQSVALALLDVLSELPELKICTHYELHGRRTQSFPSHVDDLNQAVPVYETLPGWQQDICSARHWDELPANCQRYVQRIGQLLGVPVQIVSVGPDRTQTIHVPSPARPTATVAS
jgi:adenylosuccinate synthase